MNKSLYNFALFLLLTTNIAYANDVIRINPFVVTGASKGIGYDHALNDREAIGLNFNSYFIDIFGWNFDMYMSSITYKRTFSGKIGSGGYWRLGVMGFSRENFSPIQDILPAVAIGYDKKLNDSWLVSYEFGSDISFITLGFAF